MNIKLQLNEHDVRTAVMEWLKKAHSDLVKDRVIKLEFYNGDVTKAEATLEPQPVGYERDF